MRRPETTSRANTTPRSRSAAPMRRPRTSVRSSGIAVMARASGRRGELVVGDEAQPAVAAVDGLDLHRDAEALLLGEVHVAAHRVAHLQVQVSRTRGGRRLLTDALGEFGLRLLLDLGAIDGRRSPATRKDDGE